jgi:hypothetical protein
MKDEVRASLEDLAIRWETPRGHELKAQVLADAKSNNGDGIARILKDFMYVSEVPHGRDLRCITLEDADLSDAVLRKVDLSWASLARSNMQRADLRESNLKRSNLSDTNLALARMDGCDCSRGDFSKSVLDGTHFKEAKLTGAVFENAQISRASFDSANLAKSNFHGAELAQANFFNADCNNCNFDSGALEQLATRPAKAWGLRYDLERDEFEKQVGLRAITSRATKRFKGLDVLLKARAVLEAKAPKEIQRGAANVGTSKGGDGGLYFGASPLGTRKFRPEEMEGLDTPPLHDRPTKALPEQPPATGTERHDRPTRAQRPTTAQRRPPPPRKRPPGRARQPTRRMRRPGSGPAIRPAQPAVPAGPPSPVAPLDPNAPDPSTDWAKAIGTLMQLKGQISKLVVELGDKSVIVYKTDD